LNDKRALVLIVDDNSTNIDLLVNTLKDEYRLGIAKNGPKAIEYAQKFIPDLILLDIMMPEMNGYEVCKQLKESGNTKNIPVIFITAMAEARNKTYGFEVGGLDYVTKPFHAAEVKARVKTHLSLKFMREELNSQNQILEQRVEKKTRQLQEMFYSTITAMSRAAEIRDPYTAGHQQRVSQLACAIGMKLEMAEEQISTIKYAGILHDIGKIRIPVSILTRPGKLMDAELKMIRIHPKVGYDLLRPIPFPWPIAEVVYQHHEKLDGSGYPRGLTSEEILPEAKILTVADVTEAAMSYRPYRPALGLGVALDEISTHRGTRYDVEAVDACIELFKRDNFSFDFEGVILSDSVEASLKSSPKSSDGNPES
jgi:putative two-component system response regulator